MKDLSQPMNESYQRGWNTALTDMAKGKVVTEFLWQQCGADYIEGYMAGQDYVLIERSKLREEKTL